MKNAFIILATMFMGVVLLLPVSQEVVYSVGLTDAFCANGGGSTELCNGDDPSSNPIVGADGLLTVVVRFFALITGIISVIVIILMGFRYVTANGDANKAASARQGIIYAIAGLIVALLAQTIVAYVLTKMG